MQSKEDKQTRKAEEEAAGTDSSHGYVQEHQVVPNKLKNTSYIENFIDQKYFLPSREPRSLIH